MLSYNPIMEFDVFKESSFRLTAQMWIETFVLVNWSSPLELHFSDLYSGSPPQGFTVIQQVSALPFIFDLSILWKLVSLYFAWLKQVTSEFSDPLL